MMQNCKYLNITCERLILWPSFNILVCCDCKQFRTWFWGPENNIFELRKMNPKEETYSNYLEKPHSLPSFLHKLTPLYIILPLFHSQSKFCHDHIPLQTTDLYISKADKIPSCYETLNILRCKGIFLSLNWNILKVS